MNASGGVPLRDGASLHVRVVGQGPSVLMLPGLGMDSRLWLPFVLPHRRRFRFYLPDFRGQGRSAAARFNQADVFQNHMEDVQDLIAHFGLHDFLLVGISLGASVALHLQRETGLASVRGYLHIDQSPCLVNQPGWPHGLAGDNQPALFALMHTALALLDEHAQREHFDQLPPGPKRELTGLLIRICRLLSTGRLLCALSGRLLQLPALLARKLPLTRLAVLRTYLTAYAGGGHDYRASLGLGDAPLTLMLGTRSALYASTGQLLIAERFASARVVRFERSGHLLPLSEPLKFLREFARFLDGCNRPQVG